MPFLSKMDYPIKSSAWRINTVRAASEKMHGFTLVELLIAVTILGLVLAGTYSTFFSFSKSTKVSLTHLDQSAELQHAFESIHKSMRAISEVHQTTASTFEFTTAKMDGTTERIRYFFDANAGEFIRHSVTDNTDRVLVNDVTAVKFTYFDRFGDETSTQIDMNAAKLDITSERKGASGIKSVDTETALITFRNRTI